MSRSSRSAASPGPPAPPRAASRRRSSSAGVELRLRGWRPGFDKVRFTRLLRDGGLGLSEAVALTGRLLADEEIVVRLRHLDDRHAASSALAEIGVAEVA
jgi:hypothetical protein